jgi:hypothetical protein
VNSSTAGFVSYYEAFESAEVGKKEQRDHETDHHHRGGLSVALNLRDRATARQGNRVRSKQQSGQSHTETDAARTPLRLAKRKTQPASDVALATFRRLVELEA